MLINFTTAVADAKAYTVDISHCQGSYDNGNETNDSNEETTAEPMSTHNTYDSVNYKCDIASQTSGKKFVAY